MRPGPLFPAILRRYNRFIRQTAGVAAVEFALLSMFMVSLYFGLVEASNGIMAARKVANVTYVLGDLVAMSENLTDAEIEDVFEATRMVIEPFDPSPLAMVVSSIRSDANGRITVQWSEGKNRTTRATGSTVTVPDGLIPPDTTMILSEVSYQYSSPVGRMFIPAVEMSDVFYLRPRIGNSVSRKN